MQRQLFAFTTSLLNDKPDNYLGVAAIIFVILVFIAMGIWMKRKDTCDIAQGKPARTTNRNKQPTRYPHKTRIKDHLFDEKGSCVYCGLKALILTYDDYNVDELIKLARQEGFTSSTEDGTETFIIVFEGELGQVWRFTKVALEAYFREKRSATAT